MDPFKISFLLLTCLPLISASVNLSPSAAKSFLQPKGRARRVRRGSWGDLMNAENNAERAQEIAEDSNEITRLHTAIRCREKCWDHWGSWEACTKPCNHGRSPRKRKQKTLADCKDYPCPGEHTQWRKCWMNCGQGGQPVDGACECRTGFSGVCCKTQVKCSRPPDLDSGNLDGINIWPTPYKSVVIINCNEGYVIEGNDGNDTRTCLLTGQWSGSNPTCKHVACEPPEVPAHAVINMRDGYVFGEGVAYRCQRGYRLRGSPSRKCTADENGKPRWTNFMPTCQAKICGDPGTPTNGQKVGHTYTYGAKVSFRCSRGYQLVGDAIRECLDIGKWSGKHPYCTEVRCARMEAPQHGYISSYQHSGVDEVVVFNCKRGYELEGDSTVTCRANGTWNGTAPTCNAVECPDPKRPENGERVDAGMKLNDVITYYCHDGYLLSGFRLSTCNAEGVWSSPRPTCQACPKHTYHVRENQLKVGKCEDCPLASHTVTNASTSILHCMCNQGYRGPAGGPCIEVACELPEAPSHGMLINCGSHLGETCEYSCDDGYVLEGGNSMRTCSVSGEWDGRGPTCRACEKNTYKVGDVCLTCPKHTFAKGEGNNVTGCLCVTGYQGPPGGPCEDVDECEANEGLGDCDQACTNVNGSYYCTCTRPGFDLTEDRKTCFPKDQCKNLTKADVPSHGGAVCHHYNEFSSIHCSTHCNPGYDHAARTNAFETCGPDTGFKWSFRMLDEKPNEPMPPCIPEAFPGFRNEAEAAYFVRDCEDLTDAEKDEVKQKLKETLDNKNVCQQGRRKVCEVKNMGIICGFTNTTRRRRSAGVNGEDPVAFTLDLVTLTEEDQTPENICRLIRLPPHLCKTHYKRIYKRYLKAAVMYAGRKLQQLGHERPTLQTSTRIYTPATQDTIRVTRLVEECQPGLESVNGSMCVPCIAGSYFSNATQQCEKCANNTYQPENMKLSCLPCPVGTTSKRGSKNCTVCAGGTYGPGCSEKCECVYGRCDPVTGRCDCLNGWEGPQCDQDIDGCEKAVCYPGATCTDLPAPDNGAICGECPSGYNGDGKTCWRAVQEL